MEVSEEVVRRLGRLYTSTLSNALEDVGEDGVILGLPALGAGMRCSGRALTVLEITGGAHAFPGSFFRVGDIIDSARPGEIVVIANSGHPVSTWGGTASFAAQLKKIGGLIVDGGVRDREEIVHYGFPVFSRHVVPTTGRGRIKVVEIGGMVTVCGIKVSTGDVIVADGTGIVSVPAPLAERVLEIAEKLAADDEQATREIEAGLSFSRALAKFRKI